MTPWIVAAGCTFPSGPGLGLAEVALRTHTCLTILHPHVVDACGRRVRGAFFRPRSAPAQRWVALADAAMRDLSIHLPAGIDPFLQRRAVPLWLVLSESGRPGRPPTVEAALDAVLAPHWPQRHVVRGGHAACAEALAAAQAWMEAHATPALVLAIDSAWPADTLAWLEAQHLLHGAHQAYRGRPRANPYGHIPGEGAAALLLAPPGLAPGWSRVAGLGRANEPLTVASDGPCIGAGLTTAARAALGCSQQTIAEPIPTVIHDANGEPYRADEFGFTALRITEHLAPGWQRLTPALASGDLMSASLATHLAIAAWRMHRHPAHAHPTLVLASSDDPARAAVLLTAPEI